MLLPEAQFDADVSVSLKAMGVEIGSLSLRMESSAFEPMDMSLGERIDRSKVTPEQSEALVADLREGLTQGAWPRCSRLRRS